MKALLFSLALLPLFITAAPFTLESTANGSTPGAIVIEDKSHPAIQFAAEELQKFIKLISGKYLPIRNGVELERYKAKFFLMPTDAPMFAPLCRKFAKDIAALKGTDGYAVRQIGKKEVWIFADCPRGILNGVYRFLIKNTDIVWPRPADELAIYTCNPEVAFSQTSYIEIPAFRNHGMGWNYSRTRHSHELALWTARVGSASCSPDHPANYSFARKIGAFDSFEDTYASGGHCLIRYWLPVERFGQEHPEYYMMIDGKRYVKNNANPCVTNPAVAEAFIARLKEELPRMSPCQKLVNMCIADQSKCCECDECTKPITLPDGRVITKEHPAFRSTQFHIFFNKIARAFRQMSPERHLLQYGYMFLAEPPLVPVEDNVRISFCPYIRNYKETIFGPSNEKWRARTAQWLKITANLRWREYYGCGIMFPRPIADIAAPELKYLRDNHVNEVTSEITPSDDSFAPGKGYPTSDAWDMTAIEIWTLFQLMWTPDVPTSTLRGDYLKRTYHEAAPAMERFYRLIHETWHKDKAISTFDDSIAKSFRYYLCDSKILAPCRAALADAEKTAIHPKALSLVKRARSTFEKYATDAANRKVIELKVPKVACDGFPGFDLTTGPWQKAAAFPRLPRMGSEKEFCTVRETVKIFTTGEKFYIAATLKKPAADIYIKDNKQMPLDTFPEGDHVELFVTNNSTGRYHQLAYDFMGTRWDADAHDDKWNGNWEVRGQRTADGWTTIARIPYAMVDFMPWVKNKMKFLVFISSPRKGEKSEHLSWGGVRVHSAADFGTLEFEWE